MKQGLIELHAELLEDEGCGVTASEDLGLQFECAEKTLKSKFKKMVGLMDIQKCHQICPVLIAFAVMQTIEIQLQAAPEITKEQFRSFQGRNGDLEKGKIYYVRGKIIQVGDDYVHIDNFDFETPEPFGVIKITPEFLENFAGTKGTTVSFLAEFNGYGNFPTNLGGSIRLATFNASHYQDMFGGDIQVVNKELAEKVAASLTMKQGSSTTSSGVPSSKEAPKASEVGGDKPMKADDDVRIKIAELKGELAGVNQKIEAERTRWMNASNVINKLTNNRTRPVIRNSPEHQMMYEAQLIIKDVEEKAPDLKEQKTKIEATLKALE